MTIHNIPHNPVAANTLFHFTSSIANIENILTNEFLPKYCIEDWSDIDTKISGQAYSMICFCDIPLSQIRNHISKYGGYGIGLKKEWGLENGITPVLYIHKKSKPLITLNLQTRAIIEQISELNKTIEHKLNQLDHKDNYLLKELKNLEIFINQTQPLWEQLRNQLYQKLYFKPYRGKMWEKTKLKFNKKADFYEEREWRYIPLIEKNGNAKININRQEFSDRKIREGYEIQLEKYKLSFEPEDIKYIIVNKEAEIPEMIRKIKKIKSPKYKDDIDLLITRIISMEHILADF